MEFSSPQRSLRWAYKPTRRFLQSSSLSTHYLHRLEFVEMVFGLLPLVLRISQSQTLVAGKDWGDLRVGIQHVSLASRHVGRSNTDRSKYSTGTPTYYRAIHSIRAFVQLAISNPIATCINPWFSSYAFLKDLSR